jgi:hypothetical protein
MTEQRNHVLFSTQAFNSVRDEATDVSLGGDLATAVANALQEDGYVVPSAPSAEDWGWSLETVKDGERHALHLGLMDDCEPNEPKWLVWLERRRGVSDRILGRNKQVHPQLTQSLHDAIMRLPNIKDVQWFTQADFLAGSQDKWTPTPK